MRRTHFYSISAIAVGVMMSTSVHAASVASGYDLLETPNSGKSLIVVPGGPTVYFRGNAESVGDDICGSNSFNFGSGCVGTGTADTILHRIDSTTELLAGVGQTIDLEIIALSLISTTAYDFGSGAELLEARVLYDVVNGVWVHGQDNGSQMTITADPLGLGDGVFSSALDFTMEIIGATSGTSYGDYDLVMTQDDAIWQHDPFNIYTPIIEGVNRTLNGIDTSDDFFPGPASHCSVFGCHDTIPPVPVPASLPLLAGALCGLGAIWKTRRSMA